MTTEQDAITEAYRRTVAHVLAPTTLDWLRRVYRVDTAALPLPSRARLRERIEAHAQEERARGVRVR